MGLFFIKGDDLFSFYLQLQIPGFVDNKIIYDHERLI